MSDAPLPPAVDPETLESLRALSQELDGGFEELTGVFHAEARDRLARLRTAVAAGEPNAAARLTHSLRGICGAMGATRMSDLSRQIELAAIAGEPLSLELVGELEREYARVSELLTPPPAPA